MPHAINKMTTQPNISEMGSIGIICIYFDFASKVICAPAKVLVEALRRTLLDFFICLIFFVPANLTNIPTRASTNLPKPLPVLVGNN